MNPSHMEDLLQSSEGNDDLESPAALLAIKCSYGRFPETVSSVKSPETRFRKASRFSGSYKFKKKLSTTMIKRIMPTGPIAGWEYPRAMMQNGNDACLSACLSVSLSVVASLPTLHCCSLCCCVQRRGTADEGRLTTVQDLTPSSSVIKSASSTFS